MVKMVYVDQRLMVSKNYMILNTKAQTKLTFGITNSVSGLLSQNMNNSSMTRSKMLNYS